MGSNIKTDLPNFNIVLKLNFSISDTETLNINATFPIKLKDPTIKSLQEWRESFYWKYISNMDYSSSFGNTRPLNQRENTSSVLFTKFVINTSETTTKTVSSLWPKDYYELGEEGAPYLRLFSNLSTLREGSYESQGFNMDILGAFYEDLDLSWYADKSFSQYWISIFESFQGVTKTSEWEEFVLFMQELFKLDTIWDIYNCLLGTVIYLPNMNSESLTYGSTLPVTQYKVGYFCSKTQYDAYGPTYDMPIIPVGTLRKYVLRLLKLGRIKDDTNIYSIIKTLGPENRMTYPMATYLYDMMYPSKIICIGTSTNRNHNSYSQIKYGILPAWDRSLIPTEQKDTYDKNYPTCAYVIKLEYPVINSTEAPKDMIVTTKIISLITGETIKENSEDFWESWLEHTKDVESLL